MNINKEEILEIIQNQGRAKRQTSGVYSQAFKVLDEALKVAKEHGLNQVHRAALTRLLYQNEELRQKAGLPPQSWYRRCSTLVGHFIDARQLEKGTDENGRVIVKIA